MKPAPFDYLAPRAVEEAVATLAEHGSDARILAGGQSLARVMNARLATPRVIVDINRIPGLDGIEADDGTVRIGALARQRTCELSPLLRTEAPLLAEAAGEVAHPSVRRRGTVVGSVAFADPSAELPAALLALDGEAVARGPGGERVVSAAELFAGPFRTTLRADEMITAIRVRRSAGARTGSAFVELARRRGDLPVCGVAAIVSLDEGDVISSARIALCGAHDRPVRATAAEDALTGAGATAEQVASAAQLVGRDVDPRSDAHGSAAYRRHLATILTRRSVQRALDRAREGAARA